MAAEHPKRKKHKRPPLWQMQWQFIKSLASEAFPGDDSYLGSHYDRWEGRIRAGHDDDERSLKKHFAKWEASAAKSSDPEARLYEAGDWAADIHAETQSVTSKMYGALVVSIWADMEHLLRSVLGCCRVATGKRKEEIEKAKGLCKKFSEGKTTDVQRRACIGALKQIEASIPREFADFKGLLKKEGSVVLDGCKEFHIVNAIRVLSNCYKHYDGHYIPEGERNYADTTFAQLRRWDVLDERGRIDYSKLPVQELVTACNAFYRELLGKVESHLKKTAVQDDANR
ncbi:MAG: hypothetical protein WBD75_00810 [Phycisphaerae bacterium]